LRPFFFSLLGCGRSPLWERLLNYFEPCETVSAETEVHRSRFIATVRKVLSAREAREAVKEERRLHPDARHVAFAFIIGGASSETAGMSDDGEPRGTAGRPVMEVLRGSGLRNALVTVTRYFGGVKLGTGGLVRAYSDSCRKALDLAPRAALRARKLYRLSVPYEYFDALRRLVCAAGCRVTEEAFAEQASLAVFIDDEAAEEVLASARDLCRGKCRVEAT
jgi:uncharacterized YigZ family protein